MDRLAIVSIVFIIMLFTGIGIMMTPAKISATLSGQSNSSMLEVLIMMASVLTVAGLVGMGVVGFIISKE
ncbi:MAG: hypothetical protein JO327_02715 [Nitrososphaeraceae archaeon]|nr:hypothetical protein [Nitrososphaeraceae archaeon]MBV9667022.1 hypothetical protein [Nitrososphaeraceae archaeon]